MQTIELLLFLSVSAIITISFMSTIQEIRPTNLYRDEKNHKACLTYNLMALDSYIGMKNPGIYADKNFKIKDNLCEVVNNVEH